MNGDWIRIAKRPEAARNFNPASTMESGQLLRQSSLLMSSAGGIHRKWITSKLFFTNRATCCFFLFLWVSYLPSSCNHKADRKLRERSRHVCSALTSEWKLLRGKAICPKFSLARSDLDQTNLISVESLFALPKTLPAKTNFWCQAIPSVALHIEKRTLRK